MTSVSIEQVLDEIIAYVQQKFGLKVVDTCVIDKGWLNVKWHVMTESGSIFVKYYHPKRYKLHLSERRVEIEQSLFLQQRLHESGVACPRVYSFERQFIQDTSSGYPFAMMDWVEGSVVKAGKFSTSHMYDFGKTTGRMHQLLQDVELAPSAWKPDQAACLTDLQTNLEQAAKEKSTGLITLLKQAINNVQTLDFDMFSDSPKGWTHWDLWADNVLMDEHGVAAVVDFDRMAVAYPEIDVARAILSGAFEIDGIRMDGVRAFLTGYHEHVEVPEGLILRSIKMLYLIESIWWLRTEVLQDTSVPKRFLDEMIWLTTHWEELPDIFSD